MHCRSSQLSSVSCIFWILCDGLVITPITLNFEQYMYQGMCPVSPSSTGKYFSPDISVTFAVTFVSLPASLYVYILCLHVCPRILSTPLPVYSLSPHPPMVPTCTQAVCCGKIFCQSCLNENTKRSKQCPNCRGTDTKHFKDRRSESAI